MYKINLVTRDGVSLAFDAEQTETLLEAAAKAAIFLPAVCREGGCGACRVTRTAGVVALGPYNKTALTDAERDAGDILLCRARACSDLELVAPFDRAAVGFTTIPERSARIVEISAGRGATRLVLQLEDDPALGRAAEFLPGQFMELSIPNTPIKRAYSLANTPNWDGALEFLIRSQPGGAFSAFLAEQAKIGDLLGVRGPQGSFTINEASRASRWFVAGGTGLAPILSMLRHMVEFGDASECRLFFGVNREEELFALAAIEELTKALPALQTTICVWTPQPGWPGFAGTPVEALTQALAACPARPDIYICGPPALIDAARAAALAGGVARERILSEQFSPF